MATPDWVKKELRDHSARSAPALGPRASEARVLSRGKVLQLEMTNGVVVRLPIALVPGLSKASAVERGAVEVAGRGGGLHWPRLDLDLSVSALVKTLNQYESPAMVKIGGVYYLFGSHLTGWNTNDNQYATEACNALSSLNSTWRPAFWNAGRQVLLKIGRAHV